ncbi:MAG: phosphotransferase [Acidobacteriota bacterium]
MSTTSPLSAGSASAPIPRGPQDLTREWLELHVGLEEIASVRVWPPVEDQGFTGTVVRLQVTRKNGEDTWLFAKFFDPTRGTLGRQHHVNELAFHRELAERSGLRVPRAWHGSVDDEGHGLLLLDDLTQRTRSGDVFGSSSLTDTEQLLDELAKLHGATFDSSGLSWLPRPTIDAAEQAVAFEPILAAFRERHDRRCPSGIQAVLDWLATSYETLVERMLKVPFAVVHGDLNLGNVLRDEDDGPPWLVDWQLVAVLPLAIDLSLVLGEHLLTEHRRRSERELLSRYHSRLPEACRDRYPPERLVDDYRWGLLFRLTVQVRFWSERAGTGPQRRWLEHFMSEGRLFAAVQDHWESLLQSND